MEVLLTSGFIRYVRAGSFGEAAHRTTVPKGHIKQFRWVTPEDMIAANGGQATT